MRLNLRLDPSAERMLESILDKLPQRRAKDVVVDALALYVVLVREIEAGKRPGVATADTFSEVVTPLLSEFAEQSRNGERERRMESA